MIGRNDFCWCGSKLKWKKCHFPNAGPDSTNHFSDLKKEYFQKHRILLKTPKEIQGIREASKLASHILDETCKLAKAGVTTDELNQFAHKMHMEAGAIAAPLNYGNPPFPKSICTSLNEVICHGIPSKRVLVEGDILNIDVTSILNGFYGDCSRMVIIGETTPERQLVVDVAYECLMRSIDILKPGLPISAIGDVIEDYATSKGCSVVNQFVGHGVGINFHENPQIPHSRNKINTLLVPGMTFTIEPMINAGVRTAVIDQNDQWTATTKDGRASAQWEHTILITESGHEVLTKWVR
jgi:methionyl aminopeptidase